MGRTKDTAHVAGEREAHTYITLRRRNEQSRAIRESTDTGKVITRERGRQR